MNPRAASAVQFSGLRNHFLESSAQIETVSAGWRLLTR
jgi:hypothetical protein